MQNDFKAGGGHPVCSPPSASFPPPRSRMADALRGMLELGGVTLSLHRDCHPNTLYALLRHGWVEMYRLGGYWVLTPSGHQAAMRLDQQREK